MIFLTQYGGYQMSAVRITLQNIREGDEAWGEPL